MIAAAIVPAFDAIPLPAPVWLLKALLLLTLLLHLIAMNMLFGGVWTALYSRMKSKGNASSNSGKFYKQLVAYLPTLFPATVTLGVAPLLFVQVLYGHLVYSASIAIGWYWWLVWVLVIVAYYALYYLKFKAPTDSKVHGWIPWAAALALLWISFTLSTNFNLAQQPDRFSAMLLASVKGCDLNLSDPTTFPRWLHMMLGAIAVAGVWFMWLGRMDRKRDAGFSKYKLELGYKLFAFATMANIIVGFIYMVTLPRDVMMKLMGQGFIETGLWLVSLGLAIWAIPVLKKASSEPESAALSLGTGLVAVTVALMVILRDLVRSHYLASYFTLDMPQVQVQWIPIILFLISFGIGLYLFYWLARVYLKGK